MKLIHYKEGQYNAQPDPFILKAENGKFYIYSTGVEGVRAFVSDELCGEYRDLGYVYQVEGKIEFWAPSVIYTHGKYYMYVSFIDAERDGGDAHRQMIHVASSDNPEGPFGDTKPLIEPFSIDSHVVENEEGLFMFYSVNDYEAQRVGTYVVVDKMKSPTEMVGKPTAVVRPTLDEEIFMRDRFKKGEHWHTLEGAFYFREGNTHFVIYSGNCYESEYYYLGYASAVTEERDLTKIRFEKQPSPDVYSPLIAKNEFEAGTGHNSVIKVDGEYYCVYHGRDIVPDARIEGDKRTARICKLEILNNTLRAVRFADKI